MRKVVMLAVAVMVVFAAPAALATHQKNSSNQQVCTAGGTNVGSGVVNVHAANNSNSGHLYVQSCDNMAPDGNVSAAGSTSGCGYVMIEGDQTNGEEANGKVGVTFNNGGPTVVAPSDGPFHSSCSTA